MQSTSTPLRILRKTAVCEIFSYSKSTNVLRIKEGLMTPPVVLSTRSVGWPEHECRAILAARVAGHSDEAVKALVVRLTAARKNAA
jgi:prophage regulatory protein